MIIRATSQVPLTQTGERSPIAITVWDESARLRIRKGTMSTFIMMKRGVRKHILIETEMWSVPFTTWMATCPIRGLRTEREEILLSINMYTIGTED